MTFLLLNRRRILDQLPVWFPRSRDELVVFTARSATQGVDLGALGGRLRHLEVVDDYEGPRPRPGSTGSPTSSGWTAYC